MPKRVETTLGQLAKGDYLERADGSLWKVTHDIVRDDGRWLGITMADGRREKIAPSDLRRKVTQVIYKSTSMAEAQKNLEEGLGAVKLAERPTPEVVWTMPGLSELYDADNARMLRAHLVRFHGVTSTEGMDLTATHASLHQQGADHHHEEI